ncbi:MAG: hypothetical protein P1P86_15825 [Bacteroidales bacterium]|nr:hypothetical protein [Bacteroidales bacterium]
MKKELSNKLNSCAAVRGVLEKNLHFSYTDIKYGRDSEALERRGGVKSQRAAGFIRLEELFGEADRILYCKIHRGFVNWLKTGASGLQRFPSGHKS